MDMDFLPWQCVAWFWRRYFNTILLSAEYFNAPE
jgi:hypothetical protein